MRTETRSFLWLLYILCVCMVGCGEVELQSSWRDRDIVIDADGEDWNGALSHIDWANVDIGIYNDHDALYIGVVPRGRDIQAHIVGVGCELLFDAPVENFERFGLRFPFGDQSAAMGMARGASRSEAVETIHQVSARVNTVEVLDEHGSVVSGCVLAEAAKEGIAIAIGDYAGRLLIEARIPFEFELGGKLYRINNDPDVLLELAVQTPENTDQTREELERSPFVPPSEITGSTEYEEYERYTVDEALNAMLFREQVQINMNISLAIPPSGSADHDEK